MRLRTQLMLAFVLLAVLPLSAITLYAYHSSTRALQRAAQSEAERLAREMEERMTEVTARLDRRIELLRQIPFPESAEAGLAPGKEPDAALMGRLLATLGDAADYFDSFQFDPAPDPAGAPGRPKAPPVMIHLPRFDTLAGEHPDLAAFIKPVIAMIPEKERARLDREAKRVRVDLEKEIGAAASEIARIVEMKIKEAQQERGRGAGARRGSEAPRVTGTAPPPPPLEPAEAGPLIDLGEPQEEVSTGSAPPALLPSINMKKEFACELQRGGQPVGRLRAHLSSDRLMKEVLSQTRREMGEIPFVTDAEGNLFTLDPADLPTLQRVASLASSGKAARVGDAVQPAGMALARGGAAAARLGESAAVGAGDDQWVVVMHDDPASGLVFGIARPVGDSLQEIRSASARNLGTGLGLAALALFVILPISRRMTQNLGDLTRGAERLAAGRLDTQVPVRSSDELGQLAAAFNRMARELHANQERLVEQERLRKELEMCRKIQVELLPKAPLRNPFAEVQGLSIPARELGGDFFNYFPLPGGEIGLLMGDVSGKGVPAALLMANLQATLQARLPIERDLTLFAAGLDRAIDESTPPEVYLTLFLSVLDPVRHELRYVNAGHESPILLRRDGRHERLEPTGRPIGLLPGGDYTERRASLRPGDRLFLYTDGLVDAEDEKGAPFGLERLESLLARDPGAADPKTLLARVERAFQEHRGRTDPADDATLLLLKVADRVILETAAGQATIRAEHQV